MLIPHYIYTRSDFRKPHLARTIMSSISHSILAAKVNKTNIKEHLQCEILQVCSGRVDKEDSNQVTDT